MSEKMVADCGLTRIGEGRDGGFHEKVGEWTVARGRSSRTNTFIFFPMTWIVQGAIILSNFNIRDAWKKEHVFCPTQVWALGINKQIGEQT